MSAICARLSNKGKVGVQRGRKTAGCPSFLPPRRVPRRSRRPQTANPPAEVQRKTPRPSGANPPAAVRVPRSAGAEKEPPVRGEPACGSSRAPLSRCRKGAARQGRTRLRQFACPAQPMQKRSCPSGSNPPAAVRVPRSAGAAKGAARQGRTRLRQFVCHGQPAQKRSCPSGANPPAAVRVPWSPCAEKRKAPQNCFHGAQSMHFYSNRSSVSTSLRAGACGSCAGWPSAMSAATS